MTLPASATDQATSPAWRNRIVGEGEEDPRELIPNPGNWRRHPSAQAAAMTGALDQVGWVQRVLVNQRTGRMVDGHLRVELALKRGEERVPVLYVDLDEAEEKLVLASLDPLAAMAERDGKKLQELLGDVTVDSADLTRMLKALGPRSGLVDPDFVPPVPEAPYVEPGELWLLGDHRVLCGDATDPDAVARLLTRAITAWTRARSIANLPKFLAEPGLRLDKFEVDLLGASPEKNARAYGEFLLAEFLEESQDRTIIREVWEQIGNDFVATGAIKEAMFARGQTQDVFYGEFHRANYFMTYVDPHLTAVPGGWADLLADPNNPDTAASPDIGAAPRAARVRPTFNNNTATGGFTLDGGAAEYVEIVPPVVQPSKLTIDVTGLDGVMRASVYSFATYPTTCREVQLNPVNGTATTTLDIDSTCPNTVIILSHRDATTISPKSGTWTATLTPVSTIRTGNVEIGVNPQGHLNVDGGSPSSGEGDTVVGLRYVPNNADSLSPGCYCEGWGVADATSQVSGKAQLTEGGVQNLTTLSFTRTLGGAVSTVRVGATFEVTHDFHANPLVPNVFEITTTIKNISAATTDVRYRRNMDWDIEPTYFDEYVTVQTGGSPFVLYSNNDGFVSSNPLAPRISGVVDPIVEGEFVEVGPFDHGAMFDFSLGELAPNASMTFKLYYGASGDKSGAMGIINALGVGVYSIAMPNTDPNFGLPNTFLFAFDPPPGQTPTMAALAPSAVVGAGAAVDPVPNPNLGKGE